MQLDPRTLMLCSVLVSGLHGLISLVFAVQYPNTRSLKPFGAGLLVFSVGMSGVALRGLIPDLLSVVAAHALITAAVVLVDRGMRLFTGEPVRDRLGWTLVGVTAVVQTLLYYASTDIRPRTVFLSALYALLMARTAMRLRRHAPRDGRRAYRFTQGLFWVWSALLLLRAVVNTQGPPQTDIMTPSAFVASTCIAHMAFTVLLTLGFLWMEIYWLNEELLQLARRDSLTGALNRSAFHAVCETELARAHRSGQPLSIVLFDLDHFKQINDSHGHAAGDLALCEVVRTLGQCKRSGDILGRLGGEEFGLLLPGVDECGAYRIADRTRAALNDADLEWADGLLRVRVSGGVSSFPAHGSTLSELLNAADTALYHAKRAGRNRVELAGHEPCRPASPVLY